MSSNGYQTVRAGYLDVKVPPDQSERFLHKAWRELWVCAIVFQPLGRGDPHLILQITSKKKVEKTVKAPRDGLRLFRCQSGSRPLRTWALSSGDSLLLYLAAQSENETQSWMKDIRDALWPPIMTDRLFHDPVHEVSLIDDERSFSCGLLGVYGYLTRSEEDALCLIHPHWHGTQMRWKREDIQMVKLIRSTNDQKGVFGLQVRRDEKTRNLQFYGENASSTVLWLHSFITNTSGEGLKPQIVFDCNQNDKHTDTELHHDTEKKQESEFNSRDSFEFQLPNIEGEFLNASVSLQSHEIFTTKESDDDSPEDSLYDHLYEELDGQREGRVFTLYEEIDDDSPEEPTLCQLPPPLPEHNPKNYYLKPITQTTNCKINSAVASNTSIDHMPVDGPTHGSAIRPTTLQLQKLSESVTEALKAAEGMVAHKPFNSRSSLLRKIKGKKSKSQQASPSTENQVKPIDIKRATSVPDVNDLISQLQLDDAVKRRASHDPPRTGLKFLVGENV